MPSSNLHSDPNDFAPVCLDYDGSPDGCICAIAYALSLSTRSAIVFSSPDHPQTGDLFASQHVQIQTDVAQAEACTKAWERKGGKAAGRTILRALLTMEPSIEVALLGYVRHLMQVGAAVDRLHHDPDIAFVHRCARKVSHEMHRFKGLLRFEKLADGRYLALYEPDYDITVFLAWHFAKRLRGQSWIIVDVQRQCAATWDGKRLNAETQGRGVVSGETLQHVLRGCDLDPTDREVQAQWQTFHRAVAIENRINPSLQRRCMPARYWKHLTEMQPNG